jgi:carbonic anhydrase
MKQMQLLVLLVIFMFVRFSYGQQKNDHTVTVHNETKISQGDVVIQTSNEALNELKAGNLRFVGNQLINTDYKNQIELSKDGQKPHSLILTCMDSRVPPEIIFDQGIGNIFVTRVAGNIEDENMLGSMEYAVEHSGSKLIVVMGHSHCGAVTGAVQNAESGNLTQLLEQIKPAITDGSSDTDIINKTAINNVKMTIADILKKSKIINELSEENKIILIGAFYDIETGVVTFME